MGYSGQKSALELFLNGLAEARDDLGRGDKPKPPFIGAMAELFVEAELSFSLVSHKEDNYDAEWDGNRIEIRSTSTGKKPSSSGKIFDEFCWVKFYYEKRQIWIDEIVIASKGEPPRKPIWKGPRRVL